eukprot:CAMPEP_0172548394 /NCGR_PEP_ID=MMETSP1067-20121228/17698_1 /TAXON_ID=265564 ORGANISM="Thalassiosira punctigera, Strain Tpunct2005C2" /NCGR_SAMPLE_ID=MMETSP1067 /ASSEMBLY_ACC=CAM_ASM_000444 /LENGTH=234 /DNA_ID=CAMNT_0013335601 /DNA_START=46 /DNA_END=747 /DNA_ORIENTATION=+
MDGTSSATKAKRRLDLGGSAATGGGGETKRKTKVRNPYKVSKPTSTDAARADEGGEAAVVSTVTPDAGIEKFFSSRRSEAGDAKPRAARQLVTPRHDGGPSSNGKGGRKSPGVNSEDDDVEGLYYHSDSDSRSKNAAKKRERYEPGHIHSTLAYRHRGELQLNQGTLKAYRFIRKHFLIPRDIEADPRFGPHSGSCFEERVVRAYNLGQLEPKDRREEWGELLVCYYCGEEGHK